MSLVYFQVNVVFAGIPSMPVTLSNLSALFKIKSSERVIVFHAPWDDQAFNHTKPYEPPVIPAQQDLEKTRAGEKVKEEFKPVGQMHEIPDNTQGALKQDLKDIKSENKITGSNVNMKVSGDKLNFDSLKPEQKTELNKAFEGKSVNISVVKIGAMYTVNLNSTDGKVKASLDYSPNVKSPTLQVAGAAVKGASAEVKTSKEPIQSAVNAQQRTEIPVTANLEKNIRFLGFKEEFSAVIQSSVKVDTVKGAKFVTDAQGTRFEGAISWTTTSGIKYEVTQGADGKIQKTMTALNDNAVMKDVVGGQVVAQTTFHKQGDSVTAVGGQLTSFVANSNQGIVREIFVTKTAAGKEGGVEQKPIALAASVGEYKVRMATTDTTFKMVNNEAVAVKIENNLTGKVVAERNQDGQLVGKNFEGNLTLAISAGQVSVDKAGNMFVVMKDSAGKDMKVNVVAKDDKLVPYAVNDQVINSINPAQTPFTRQVPDANGKATAVNFNINHFSFDAAGQLNVQGLQNVPEGKTFKAGNIYQAGGPGITGSGSSVSHDIDTTIAKNGDVTFTGKAGGQVAFTDNHAAMVSGKADNISYNPLTAGSYNVTVKNGDGKVLATADKQGVIQRDGSAPYTFSKWTINPDGKPLSKQDTAIVDHFKISDKSAAVVDAGGNTVAVASLNKGKAVYVEGMPTQAGRAAMMDLAFKNDPSLWKSFESKSIDTAMTEAGTVIGPSQAVGAGIDLGSGAIRMKMETQLPRDQKGSWSTDFTVKGVATAISGDAKMGSVIFQKAGQSFKNMESAAVGNVQGIISQRNNFLDISKGTETKGFAKNLESGMVQIVFATAIPNQAGKSGVWTVTSGPNQSPMLDMDSAMTEHVLGNMGSYMAQRNSESGLLGALDKGNWNTSFKVGDSSGDRVPGTKIEGSRLDSQGGMALQFSSSIGDWTAVYSGLRQGVSYSNKEISGFQFGENFLKNISGNSSSDGFKDAIGKSIQGSQPDMSTVQGSLRPTGQMSLTVKNGDGPIELGVEFNRNKGNISIVTASATDTITKSSLLGVQGKDVSQIKGDLATLSNLKNTPQFAQSVGATMASFAQKNGYQGALVSVDNNLRAVVQKTASGSFDTEIADSSSHRSIAVDGRVSLQSAREVLASNFSTPRQAIDTVNQSKNSFDGVKSLTYQDKGNSYTVFRVGVQKDYLGNDLKRSVLVMNGHFAVVDQKGARIIDQFKETKMAGLPDGAIISSREVLPGTKLSSAQQNELSSLGFDAQTLVLADGSRYSAVVGNDLKNNAVVSYQKEGQWMDAKTGNASNALISQTIKPISQDIATTRIVKFEGGAQKFEAVLQTGQDVRKAMISLTVNDPEKTIVEQTKSTFGIPSNTSSSFVDDAVKSGVFESFTQFNSNVQLGGEKYQGNAITVRGADKEVQKIYQIDMAAASGNMANIYSDIRKGGEGVINVQVGELSNGRFEVREGYSSLGSKGMVVSVYTKDGNRVEGQVKWGGLGGSTVQSALPAGLAVIDAGKIYAAVINIFKGGGDVEQTKAKLNGMAADYFGTKSTLEKGSTDGGFMSMMKGLVGFVGVDFQRVGVFDRNGNGVSVDFLNGGKQANSSFSTRETQEGRAVVTTESVQNGKVTTIKTFRDMETGKNVKQEVTDTKGFTTRSWWSESKSSWGQAFTTNINNEVLFGNFRESDLKGLVTGGFVLGAIVAAPFTGGGSLGALALITGAGLGASAAMENSYSGGSTLGSVGIAAAGLIPMGAGGVGAFRAIGAWGARAGLTANVAQRGIQALMIVNFGHDAMNKFYYGDKTVTWGRLAFDAFAAFAPAIIGAGGKFAGASGLARAGVVAGTMTTGAIVGGTVAALDGNDFLTGAALGATVGLLAPYAMALPYAKSVGLSARLATMNVFQQTMAFAAGPGLISLYAYGMTSKDATMKGAAFAFLGGFVAGGALRLMGGQLTKLAAFAAEPAAYYQMAYKSAVGWAGFGFLGVGSLLPSYNLAENKWEWNPSHMLSMSTTERFTAAITMFKEGLTMGPFLHALGFQPAAQGIGGRLAEKQVSGMVGEAMGLEVLANVPKLGWKEVLGRTVQSASVGFGLGSGIGILSELTKAGNEPINWNNVLTAGNIGTVAGLVAAGGARFLGKVAPATQQSKYLFSYTRGVSAGVQGIDSVITSIESSLAKKFPKLAGSTGFAGIGQSGTQFISLALAGGEGVLPFHALTQVGSFIGQGAAKAFGLSDSDALGVSGVFSSISMFFAPMGNFGKAFATEMVQLGRVGVINAILEGVSKASVVSAAEGKPTLGTIEVAGLKVELDAGLLMQARVKAVDLIKSSPELLKAVNNFNGDKPMTIAELDSSLKDHAVSGLLITNEVKILAESSVYAHLTGNLGHAPMEIAKGGNVSGFDISSGLQRRGLAAEFQKYDRPVLQALMAKLASVGLATTIAVQPILQAGEIRFVSPTMELRAGQEKLNVDANTIKEAATEALYNNVFNAAYEGRAVLMVEAKAEIQSILKNDKSLTAEQRDYLELRVKDIDQGNLSRVMPLLMTMYIQKNFSPTSDHLTQAFFKEKGIRMEMADIKHDVSERAKHIEEMKQGGTELFKQMVDVLTGKREAGALKGSEADLLIAAENGDTGRVEKILGENGKAQEMLDAVMGEGLAKIGLTVTEGAGFMSLSATGKAGKLEAVAGNTAFARARQSMEAEFGKPFTIKELLGEQHAGEFLKRIGNEAYGSGPRTFQQAFTLTMLSQRVFFEHATGSKAVESAGNNWSPSKSVGQVAFVLNGLAGRISSLSTGAGKSAGFLAVFGILHLQGKLNLGEYLVATRQDVTSFIRDYKEFGHAIGLNFVDGSKLYYAQDFKSLSQMYESKGKGTVVVMDLDARGFTELTARTSGDRRLDNGLNNVTARGIDESDVAALSQKAFRMAQAATDSSGFASADLVKTIGQKIDAVEGLLSNWKGKDAAYTVEEGKRVKVSKEFYDLLKKENVIKPEDNATAAEAMISNILRAKDAMARQGETGVFHTVDGKTSHVMLEGGIPMVGTKDGSNFFNVAISMMKMRDVAGVSTMKDLVGGKMKAEGKERLKAQNMSVDRIEISIGFGEATLSRIFARQPGNGRVLNFGGSATLDVAREIATMIYGSEAVELQGSTLNDYGQASQGKKKLSIAEYAAKEVSKLFISQTKRGEGTLAIILGTEMRKAHLFDAIEARYGDRKTTSYDGKTGKKALDKWREDNKGNIEKMNLTDILKKVATEVLGIKAEDISLKHDANSKTLEADIKTLMIKRANALEVDVIDAETASGVVSQMASFTAGRIILGNLRATRALNFADSRLINESGEKVKGKVNGIYVGFEGQTIGILLQALGRVGRGETSRTQAGDRVERHLFVDKAELVKGVGRVVETDTLLGKMTEGERSLFGDRGTKDSKGRTLQDKLDSQKTPETGKNALGDKAKLRDMVELTAELNAAEAKSWSVSFKIGTETHNILIKDPLNALIQLSNTEKGVEGKVSNSDKKLIESTLHRIIEGAEKAKLEPVDGKKSPDQLAREQFKQTLEEAESVWGGLKEKISNPSLRSMAEAAHAEAKGALTNFEAKFEKALVEARELRASGKPQEITFADVKAGAKTAETLLKIVADMTDLLLPAEGAAKADATVRTAPQSITQFEAAAKQRTRGSPEAQSKAASDMAEQIKSDPTLANPDGTLTYKGQVVAAGALLASSWNDDDKNKISNAIDRLGLPGSGTLDAQNSNVGFAKALVSLLGENLFNRSYGQINLNQVLQLSQDLDQILAPGETIGQDDLKNILYARKPYEELARYMANDENSSKLNPSLNLASWNERITRTDALEEKNKNFDYKNTIPKADGTGRKAIWPSLVKVVTDFLPGSEKRQVANLQTPTVAAVSQMANDVAPLAVALTSILNGGIPFANRTKETDARAALSKVFSEGESTGRDLGKMKAADLAQLSYQPDRVGQARFDDKATRPVQIAEQKWFKPTMAVSGLAIGLTAGALLGPVGLMTVVAAGLSTGLNMYQWGKDVSPGKTAKGIASLIFAPLAMKYVVPSILPKAWAAQVALGIPSAVAAGASVIGMGALWLAIKYPVQSLIDRYSSPSDLRTRAQSVLAGEKASLPLISTARSQMLEDQQAVYTKDEKATLEKLNSELASINDMKVSDEEKAKLTETKQQEIKAFKEEIEKNKPVEGMTIRRIADRVLNSNVKEADRPEALRAALVKMGVSDEKAEAIVNIFKNKDEGFFKEEWASLQDKEIKGLIRDSTSTELLTALRQYESELEPAESITIESINSYVWTLDPEANADMRNAVVDYYAGEKISADDRLAIRSVEAIRLSKDDAATDFMVASDGSIKNNQIRADWATIKQSGVHVARAEAVRQRWPDSPVAQAAKTVAAQQSLMSAGVKTILTQAKVDPALIKNLLGAIGRESQFDSAKNRVGTRIHQALDKILAVTPAVDRQKVGAAVEQVKRELEKNYFGAPVLVQAVSANDVGQNDLATLMKVAGVSAEVEPLAKIISTKPVKTETAKVPESVNPNNPSGPAKAMGLGQQQAQVEETPAPSRIVLDRSIATKPNAGQKFNVLFQLVIRHGISLKDSYIRFEKSGGPGAFLAAADVVMPQLVRTARLGSQNAERNVSISVSADGRSLEGLWIKQSNGAWTGVDVFGNGVETIKTARWDSFDSSFSQSIGNAFFHWDADANILYKIPSAEVAASKPEGSATLANVKNGVFGFSSALSRLFGVATIGALLAIPSVSQAQSVLSTAPEAVQTSFQAVSSWSPALGTAFIVVSVVAIGVGALLLPSALSRSVQNEKTVISAASGNIPSAQTFAPVEGKTGIIKYTQSGQEPVLVDVRALLNTPAETKSQGVEKIQAFKVTQVGDTVRYEPLRGLKTLEFADATVFPVQEMKDLTIALSKIETTAPMLGGAVDQKAVRSIASILARTDIGTWAAKINVGALLRDLQIDSKSIQSKFGVTVSPNLTLGQVNNIKGDDRVQEFKDFVYQTVAANSESLSTRGGSLVAENTVKNLSKEEKTPIILGHSHPGVGIPSLSDRMSLLQQDQSNLPGIILSGTGVTLYNIAGAVLTIGKSGRVVENQSRNYAVQSLGFQFVTEGDKNSPLNKLISRISEAFSGQFLTALFGRGWNPESARGALDLVGDLTLPNGEYQLSPVQARQAWNLVGAVAVGAIGRAEIDTYLGELSGRAGLGDIIYQLGRQMNTHALSVGSSALTFQKLFKADFLAGLDPRGILEMSGLYFSSLLKQLNVRLNNDVVVEKNRGADTQVVFIPYKDLGESQKTVKGLAQIIKISKGKNDVVVLATDSEFTEANALLAPFGILVVRIENMRNVTRQNQEAILEAYSRIVFGTTRIRLVANVSGYENLDIALKDLITPLVGDKAAVAQFLFQAMSVDPVSQLNKIFLQQITSRHA